MKFTLVIEDDDGFITEHPWPVFKLMSSNPKFVDLCMEDHDRERDAWEQERDR